MVKVDPARFIGVAVGQINLKLSIHGTDIAFYGSAFIFFLFSDIRNKLIMKLNRPFITEYTPASGSKLYSSSLGNILFGCPPEILKFMMQQHLPLPDAVVIPDNGYAFHSSQSCLEFPFYHFLFIQQGLARGKKFKVFANPSVCNQLYQMLKVTLLGLDKEEMFGCWKKLGIDAGSDIETLEQIFKESEFLALKAADGQPYQLKQMVDFIPLKLNESTTVYEAFKGHPAVEIKRLEGGGYHLMCEDKIDVNLSIDRSQIPIYDTPVVKVTPEERSSQTMLNVRCLGGSEGFDPTDAANGLLFRLNGKWLLWDCPAYLHHYLEKIELDMAEIEGIFLSHVHEDHLEVAETFLSNKTLNIYSTPEIYHCFLLKVMAVKNCSYEDAKGGYHFHPIYVGQPYNLFGAEFELFYSVHSIQAVGLKLTVENEVRASKIFISGDNLAKRMINMLDEKNVFSKKRIQEIESVLSNDTTYDFVFADVGSGIIHGDPEDYFKVKSPVVYMHTGKTLENIPSHHRQFKSGQQIIIHE